jgi:phage shock protein A
MTFFVGSTEFNTLLRLLEDLETKMNALQTAVATLTTDVNALAAALTAAQANQFTAADVANITSIDNQVKAALASLNPTPTPTPSPSPAPTPTPTS